MKLFELFQLAIGLLWSAVTIFFLITLFSPRLWRRYQEWQIKVKRPDGPIKFPSWLQRLVFVLLCSLMSSVVILHALHYDHRQTAA